jgi:subtilisin-like proprotein convertase family protein
MRLKTHTWILISLAAFAAALWCWNRGNQLRNQQPPAPPPPPAAPAATAVPPVPFQLLTATVTNLLDPAVEARAEEAEKFAAQRQPFRLRNTPERIDHLLRNERAVLLRNALLDTARGGALDIPAHLRALADPGSYIVQAAGRIDDTFRAELAAAGARVVSYVPNNAYLIEADAGAAARLRTSGRVAAVLPMEPYYKLHPELLPYAIGQIPTPESGLLRLTLLPGATGRGREALQQLGARVMREDRSPFGPQLIVLPPRDALPRIAQLAAVQAVEPFRQRVPMNDLTRVRVGVSPDPGSISNHLGLTGAGVVVNVNDRGVDPTHPDLSPRVVVGGFTPALDTSGHGTHVAGVIASSGAGSPVVTVMTNTVITTNTNTMTLVTNLLVVTNIPGSVTNSNFRGMAPAATILSLAITYPSLFPDSTDNSFQSSLGGFTDTGLQEAGALTNILVFGKTNALISNNSWGYDGAFDYDSAAATYDAATRDAVPGVPGAQPVVYIFAAGNSGGGGNNGQGGAASSITSPGSAKNVITVGALEQLRNLDTNFSTPNGFGGCITQRAFQPLTDSSNQVRGSSSRGNVGIGEEGLFGRFKPDLVAPGAFTVSTRSTQWDTNAYYNPVSGSSQLFPNRLIPANSTNTFSLFVPASAYEFRIIASANANSPVPFPNLEIYASTVAPPPSPAANPANLVGTNIAIINTLSPNWTNDVTWYYDIVNTNPFPVPFDLTEQLFTTNNNCDYYVTLAQLNSALEPGYRYESGTSASAPVVSGLAALMQEFYEQRLSGANARVNSPAMIKALLINGARSAGILYDYNRNDFLNLQGWGLPNIRNSAPAAVELEPDPARWPVLMFDQSAAHALATGESHVRTLTVAPTANDLVFGSTNNPQAFPLRITLVWTDPPANPLVSAKLVNDLDLVVTNLDTGEVYFGNNFLGDGDFTSPVMTNTNGVVVTVSDVINNVENVYINAPLGTNYAVAVIARSVNVNALTDHPDGVVQDYALVISSGNPNLSGAFTVSPPVLTTPTAATRLRAPPVVTVTNSAGVVNSTAIDTNRVGANSPLLSSTNGSVQQWAFFAITNEQSLPNALFATLFPPNLSRPRGLSRIGQADVDLYVSTDPALTNLAPAAVDASFKSRNRGGNESIVLSNAVGGVYYVGVKSEDQQGAEVILVARFSSSPFSSQNPDGSVDIYGYPMDIPDGTPDQPGGAEMILFSTAPIDNIRRVVVSNTVTHELFEDLVGVLEDSQGTQVVLNNNRGEAGTNFFFIYDDSGETNSVPGSRPSDGPGTLQDYVGQSGFGLWRFTMVDNALNHTGRVEDLVIHIEPSRITNGASRILLDDIVCYPPDILFLLGAVDVPPDAVALTIAMPQIAAGDGPLEVYVRRGAPPTTNLFDYSAVFQSPAGQLTITIGDVPPLSAGRYFISILNRDTDVVCTRTVVFLDLNPAALAASSFVNTNTLFIFDDTLTNGFSSRIFVPSARNVTSVRVGVRVKHERPSDLALHLLSPRGSRVLLAENRNVLGAGLLLKADGYGLGTNAGEYAYTTFSDNTNVAFTPMKFATNLNFVEFIRPVLIATNYLRDLTNGVDQLFTGAAIQGSSLFLSGITRNTPQLGDDGIMARFDLPMQSDDPPAWSLNWPANSATQNPDFFNGLAATIDGVYGVGGSLDRTFDFVPPQESKANVVKFLLDGQPGGGFAGAVYDNQVPFFPHVFPYGGLESNNAVAATIEGGFQPVLYVTGDAQENAGNLGRLFVARVEDFGFFAFTPWVTNDVTTNGVTAFSSGRAITVYKGFIYVAGRTDDSGSPQAYFLKFDTNGAPVFAPTAIGANAQYNGICGFADHIYTVGSANGLAGASADALISKWTTSGTLVWSRTYDLGNNEDILHAVVGVGDRLYAVGSSVQSGNADMLLLEVDQTAGDIITTTYFDAGRGLDDVARAVVSDGFDLYVAGAGRRSTNFNDSDAMVLRYRIKNDMLPEEPLSALVGERASGNWYLEAWDTRVGAAATQACVLSWQLQLQLAPTGGVATPLLHQTPVSGSARGGGWRHFVVHAPFTATKATLTLTNTTPGGGGNLALVFNQTGLPNGTNPPNYVIASGSGNLMAMLDLATIPTLIPGQRFYLGVTNVPPNQTNDFDLNVEFDSTATTFMSPLASFNAAFGAGTAGAHLYQFSLLNGAPAGAFQLRNLTGAVEIILRRGAVPNGSQFDYRLVLTNGNFGQVVLRPGELLPAIGGTWFVSVRNLNGSPANYNARFVGADPIPTLMPLVAAGSGASVNWNSIPGDRYEIQVSSNLVTWLPYATNTAAGSSTTFVDPTPPGGLTNRFYRVRLLSP